MGDANYSGNSINTIKLKDISKSFTGVKALNNVSLDVKSGEILAVVGENGAGKSTIMKVLSGFYPEHSFDGEIFFNNAKQKFSSRQDAEEMGIVLIPQELNVVPDMSIAENIFLNREEFFVNENRMAIEANKLLKRLNIEIDTLQKIKHLGVGQRQMCLLARALVNNASFVIFDEPTASLGGNEVDVLFKVIKDLKKEGVGCVFISHRIDEVMNLADRVIVMRNGEYVTEYMIEDVTANQIINSMIGRNLSDFFHRDAHSVSDVVLKVNDYSVYSSERCIAKDINFSVKKGEIVSIFGLVGAGRTELINGIIGMWDGLRSGTVEIDGEICNIASPHDAIRNGIGVLSEDRHRYGTFMDLGVDENANIGSLEKICSWQYINRKKFNHRTAEAIKSLNIKTATEKSKISTLSGGNQQKVLIARLLMMEPKIIILDEPTRGVDVGAKAEIFTILNQLTNQGLGVLMISSEALEVLGVSDRILVLYKGKITAEFNREEATEEKLLVAAAGGTV